MTITTESAAPASPLSELPAARVEEDGPPRVEPRGPSKRRRGVQKRAAVAAVLTLTAAALVAVLVTFSAGVHSPDDSFVYYTVHPMDLPITVTERGTLESQHNEKLICEVDDVHGDGIYGTPILWIVENGKSVKKGDLLVELDAATHLERLDTQVLETEQAEARQIQARIRYENRLTLNETALASAILKKELADLALQQFEDENGGTYQIAVQEVELAIQQLEAREKIDRENEVGVEHLYGLGYKSKGDLDQARLRALRARVALDRENARHRELRTFDYVESKLKLTGARDSAIRNLTQVQRNNKALLEQAKIGKDAAQRLLEREQERLTRYREQLEKCKIYAPQDGMVAYAMEAGRRGSSTSVIAEGVPVRDQQPLLSLPDLKHMQVKTAVHESVVDQIKAGMKATIRLDAFPDRQYEGVVKSVAVLPDPGNWFSSDTKVYETIVTINGEVNQLKPGMTAVAELSINYLCDVLCVPAQAVVQRGDDTWCFVAAKGRVRKQPITVGQTNDKFVEISGGLADGDTVILNPAAILDQQQDRNRIAPDRKKHDAAALQ